MNYEKIYEALITRSKGRKKSKNIYYEKHHVLPKCIGGTNEKDNLALLTAEEHWIAHLLLVKIYPNEPKLVYACQAMSMVGGNTQRVTNKMFGWIRKKYSESVSNRQRGVLKTPEQCAKISKKLKGRIPEHQKIKNVSQRPEVAKKISEKKRGKSTGPFTAERKENIRKSKIGKSNSFFRNDNPNNNRICCLICKKETTYPSFKRFHLNH